MKTFDFDFKDIIDAAQDVIIITKAGLQSPPGLEIVYVNEAFTKLTEYPPEEAIGNTPKMLQRQSETSAATRQKIRQALEQKVPVRATIKNFSKSGRAYWLDLVIRPLPNKQGELAYFVAIEREITQQKELEMQLDRLSKTDPLTGLANRRALDIQLSYLFNRFTTTGTPYAIIAFDLDHFKAINDQFGHHIGDVVLKKTAETCQHTLMPDATIARTGGEEFCILLPDRTLEEAYVAAEQLRKVIASSPIRSRTFNIALTASFGVARVSTTDYQQHEALIRADNAMYQAKRAGRNQTCCNPEQEAILHIEKAGLSTDKPA